MADFVCRDFTAEEPDLVWCGDLTEIDTGEGKLYWATVIDLFSRRLLGYAMASGMMRSWWWRRSTWPRPPAAATYAA